MYYMSLEKSSSGAYPPLQTSPKDGLIPITEEQMQVFTDNMGFVTVTTNEDGSTVISPNKVELNKWLASIPDPLPSLKDAKQEENKAALKTWLYEHPLTWVDGKVYGVTEEDQNEMAMNLQQYTLQKQAGREVVLEWHTQKKQCHTFTEEEYGALMLAVIDYVYPYRRRLEEIKESIYSCKTEDELDRVVIDYDTVAQKTE